MSVPTDRRVRRTRESLRGALLSLIQEKGYDRISVQDILDRADVGRSTFYAHYRDKDDLFLAGFADIRAALTAARNAADTGAEEKDQFMRPTFAVFQHVEGHRYFWESLSRKGGADFVIRILRESVSDLVREDFRAQFRDTDARQDSLEAAIQFVTGACMSLLIWWVDTGSAYSAEEIHSIFRALATQGVGRFLANF